MDKVKKGFKKFLKVIVTLTCILICLAIIAFLAGFAYIYSVIKDVPQIDTGDIQSLLSENSIIYDDKGEALDSVFLESRRTNVSYGSLPENLKNAFIAVEDKTFWTHRGFNITRMAGAVIEAYKTGDKISGTSTITQQLARNLYLMDVRTEYSAKRKIIEAYYAVLLEKDLTKEQILEAYLNRISLGFGTCGVEAAAQAYFDKNVEDLTLSECVALAAITQEPNSYALIKTLPSASVGDDNADVLYRNNTYAYLNNVQASEKRRQMILGLMKEQGLITEQEYQDAMADDLRDHIDPSVIGESDSNSYFTDFATKEVVGDLMYEFGFSEDRAWDMLFNGGLRIYTTIDVPLQEIIENEFEDDKNFPGITGLVRDKNGNIMKPSGGVLLYSYDNYFDEEGNFVIRPDEFVKEENGDVLLLRGKRLNFYRTESGGLVDFTVNFKSMYVREDGALSTISEGTVLIPAKYKDRDDEGNLIIQAQFFKDFPGFFSETDKGLSVPPKDYTLNQKVIQPQSAMTLIDYETGEIKAMVGGRSTTGRLLYNRAVNPRQPGSSIKPISVYGPALQSAADDISGEAPYAPQPFADFTPEIVFEGRYWTAASVINDQPIFLNEKQWPKNWYAGNRGPASLRTSIEQSINVNAVKVFSQIGPDRSLAFMKKLGITTVVETGNVNDINPAAMALGGMSAGISPLEMAGAYGTFANGGRYNKPVAYTKVTNRNGDILLEHTPENAQVMDPGAAFILTDILRTTVTNGIAGRAAVKGRTVAGKTGTTTDNYDAWFVGLSSGYAASLWIGNDVNIELNEGSVAAARLWGKIMALILENSPEKGFPPAPENVINVGGEYFIRGTEGNSLVEYVEPEEEVEEEVPEGEAGDSYGFPVEGHNPPQPATPKPAEPGPENPENAQPPDIQPADTQPADTQPAEPEPENPQPAEPQTEQDTRPAWLFPDPLSP